MRLMGIDCKLVARKDADNIAYSLFVAANDEDRRSVVRVVDDESGEVVSLTSYPRREAATVAYRRGTMFVNSVCHDTEMEVIL